MGRNAVVILEERGFEPAIIEQKVELVEKLKEEQRLSVFGDAALPAILEAAHIGTAVLLVIAILDISTNINIIKYTYDIHPNIKIIAYAQDTKDCELLKDMGVEVICCEEIFNHALKKALSAIAFQKNRLGPVRMEIVR